MASVIKKKKRIPSKIPYFATGIYGAFYLMQMNFTSIREWITLGIGSVLIYFISTKIFRGNLVEYEVPVQYEDMSVQEILSTGNLYMDSFEKKRRKVQNYEVRLNIRNIIHVSNQILEEVRNDPSDVKKIRKFITYYLPTIDKVLNSYVDMEKVAQTPQIIESKKKIEELLKTVEKAFLSLYDSLFENETLDLMTDISVLEKVIEQEGLTEKQVL